MNCNVRFMEKRDVEQCYAIEHITYQGNGFLREDFHVAIVHKTMMAIVATEDDRAVGYAILMVRKSGIYLCRIVVCPERRRMKVGSSLVQWLQKWAGPERPIIYSMDDVMDNQWFLIDQDFLRANGFKLGKVIRRERAMPCYQFYVNGKCLTGSML